MPNVLWITLDDVSYTFYQRRAQEAGVLRYPQTPNLNTFADGGLDFSRYYVEPACSLTRASMALGKHPFRSGVGINTNLVTEGAPQASESWITTGLDGVAARGTFGKWHLLTQAGGVDSWRVLGGFDKGIGSPLSLQAPLFDYWYWARYEDDTLSDLVGAPLLVGQADGLGNRIATNYATTVQVDDAKAWIEAQGGDWFCWLQLDAPHSPIDFAPSAAERSTAGYGGPLMSAGHDALCTNYRIYQGTLAGDAGAAEAAIIAAGWDPDSEAGIAAYVSMLEAIDTEIGRLLGSSAIDTSTDTWVFIGSDNGEPLAQVQEPFSSSAAKGSVGEVGLRVPLLVQGPGISAGLQGKQHTALVQGVDLWATTLAIFGVNTATAYPGVTVDGIDVSACFTDLEARPRTYGYSETFSTQPNATATVSNPKGGITDAATGTTADPDYGPVTAWERATFDHGWKFKTIQPTGPASTLGDITYELHAVRADWPEARDFVIVANRLPQGPADLAHSEAAWEAYKRLKAAEDALLPSA